MEMFEEYAVTRPVAAAIAGISESQLRIWLDRTQLLGERKPGSGFHLKWTLRPLMTIAVAAALKDAGFAVETACDVPRQHSMLGAALHGTSDTLTLTQNKDGRWVAAEMHGARVSITVHIVDIFIEVFAKLAAEIRADERLSGTTAAAIIGEGMMTLQERGWPHMDRLHKALNKRPKAK